MKKYFLFSLLSLISIRTYAISPNTDNTTSRVIIEQIVSGISNGLAFENRKYQIANKSPKYTQQYITCMANSSNDFAVQALQELLEKNFNQTELRQMNTFFASTSGKKYAQFANNFLTSILTKNNVPTVEISPQEQQQIDTFWRSATGNKLGLFLKNKPKLRPTLEEITNNKQVDCNLLKSIM